MNQFCIVILSIIDKARIFLIKNSKEKTSQQLKFLTLMFIHTLKNNFIRCDSDAKKTK